MSAHLPEENPKPIEPKKPYTLPFKGVIQTSNGMKFNINARITVEAWGYNDATKKMKEQLPQLVQSSMATGVKLIKFNLL